MKVDNRLTILSRGTETILLAVYEIGVGGVADPETISGPLNSQLTFGTEAYGI